MGPKRIRNAKISYSKWGEGSEGGDRVGRGRMAGGRERVQGAKQLVYSKRELIILKLKRYRIKIL